MNDGAPNPLVNLGDFAKPADTLIKKISKAVGGVFEPYQIRRIAKAKSEAAIITAKAQIEITDLHRRAMHRFVEEEASRQQNIEEITSKALPHLKDEANPTAMEDDWVTNFFDKSRIISDGEMQTLWARILAGEANTPGTYSKRTVNFLGDLDKRDAELFQSLCRFGWVIGKFTPLVFDTQAPIYTTHGLNFNALAHLDSIGLIQFNHLTGFARLRLPKNFSIFYCGRPLDLTLPKDKDNELPIGLALLTQVGQELATVCEVPGIPGFDDYVKEHWKNYLTGSGRDEPTSPEKV